MVQLSRWVFGMVRHELGMRRNLGIDEWLYKESLEYWFIPVFTCLEVGEMGFWL
jgi:hypothetical protein